MAAIVIRGFGGKIPRYPAQLLPANAATQADNLKTFGRSLSSWFRGTEVVDTLVTGTQAIYRMYSGASDFWLAWAEQVDVVRSPGATDFRLFYTGQATPRKTNFTLATDPGSGGYPRNYREMGIPAPPAPVASVNVAGSGSPSTRNYIATYVTDWGEEGPPSAPSNNVSFNDTGFTIDLSGLEQGKKSCAITRASSTATVTCAAHGFRTGSKVTIAGAVQSEYNGTFIITVVDANTFTYTVPGTPATPATGTITAAGNYGLSAMRIYRSLTGSTGIVGYQLVKERSLATTTDTDTVLDSALGVICPSFETNDLGVAIAGSEWEQPPADLRNIVLHPGNFAVGISGNLLCFSEPDRLWAWPTRYQIALDFDGAGLGVVGSTVVVATSGKAYKVTGQHPSVMTKDSDDGSEPCASGRGVVSMPFGVLYPTPNGIQLIGIGGSVNALEEFAQRDQWRATYFPDTIFATHYQNSYFGFYDDGARVRGFVFDRSNDLGAFTDLDYDITAIYTDSQTETMYYVSGDVVYEWEGDELNLAPYEWHSKEFVLPRAVNFSWAQIDADWEAQTGDFAASQAQKAIDQAYNAAILDDDPMANIPARANTTAYTVGQTVKLSERQLVCTVAGTSAGAPPSLAGLLLGQTVADGGVTWKLIWQLQSPWRGGMGESQYNEFTLHGSLLRDPAWADYDNRSMTFRLYARCKQTNVVVDRGNAQGGSSTTLTLAALSSAVDDEYRTLLAKLTDGSGRERRISDYVGSTRVATLETRWQQNHFRNAGMAGAGVGTPGTVPTNWAMPSTGGGLTRTIVAIGTDSDGHPYIDVRYFGTGDGAAKFVNFDSLTFHPALQGDTWAFSFYLTLVGGSWVNLTATQLVLASTNSDASQTTIGTLVYTPTATKQRFSIVGTMTSPLTQWVRPYFQFTPTNAQAIDFTLRIHAPQLEKAADVGTFLNTTGTQFIDPVAGAAYEIVDDKPRDVLELKHTQVVRGSDPFRLPGGFTSHVQKVALSGNIEAYALKMAENMRELMQV